MITEQKERHTSIELQDRKTQSEQTPTHLQDCILTCADGVSLSATLYIPSLPPRGVLILASALAVPRRFYRHIAKYLSRQGYQVLTFDYRGCGSGQQPESPRLAEWGTQDIEAAIDYALKLLGNERVFLMGHSIGGQLVGLAPKADKLRGIIMVAASFPFLGRWPYPRRLLLQLLFNILVPVIGSFSNRFPSKGLGLSSMNLPSSLIQDWARWIRQDDYLLDSSFGFSPEQYRRLTCPMRVYGFDDDPLVPRASIGKLLSVFGSQNMDEHFVQVQKSGLKKVGHMGFFRPDLQDSLWKETLHWLDGNL